MVKPLEMEPNEAWLGFEIPNFTINAIEGKAKLYVLMDMYSAYVFAQEVVLGSHAINPPIRYVDALFMKAFAKAFKYPSKLIVPEEQKEKNGFVEFAKTKNIAVEYIALADLDQLVSPLVKIIQSNTAMYR